MRHMKTIIVSSICLTLCAGIAHAVTEEKLPVHWNLDRLYKAPVTYPAPGFEPRGEKDADYGGIMNTPELREKDKSSKVRALFFESVPLNGKPTRVFAWYGVPEVPKGTKLPAMVLVHGGGGTAYESWVRLWNARGYAAIAMDTTGCVPIGQNNRYPWQRSGFGGPSALVSEQFDQAGLPAEDQWAYHAISAVILANSLVRSFPEVDPDRIGLTGISWGGWLTCIAAGVDQRFRFVAPIYGCGFLAEHGDWPELDAMGWKGKRWLELFDPSHYLGHARMPMLWVDGTNDAGGYRLDSVQKSYRLPKGPRTLCTRVRMPHAHGGAGENPAEILAFADSLLRNGKPLARITGQGKDGETAWASYKSKVPVLRAELNYTTDSAPLLDKKWETIPAQVLPNHRVTAVVPAGTKLYYLNLIDERGMVSSTEHVEQ